MINKADVSMLIYRRMYVLGRTLDERDFIPRVEELVYILEEVRKFKIEPLATSPMVEANEKP